MKKGVVLLLVGLIMVGGCQRKEQQSVSLTKPRADRAISGKNVQMPASTLDTAYFYVYSDRMSELNHFTSSGWIGDHPDVLFIPDSKDAPYSGQTCINIAYSNKATNRAMYAGFYWLQPVNNWGFVPNAGYDLRKYAKLTFWAKGKKGAEVIREFRVGGVSGGPYPDSAKASIGPIVLTPEWKQYTIDLSGKDLSYIIGGFYWMTTLQDNPEGCSFFLDEIRYE